MADDPEVFIPKNRSRWRRMSLALTLAAVRLAVMDAEETVKAPTPLDPELLGRMDAYWRAANYVSVGQIYLYENPLLKEPLTLAHVKPLVVSHWGTTPGQNFIYVHLNRAIKKYDLNMFYIAGPGHGGPAIVGRLFGRNLDRDVSQHDAG